MRVIDADLLHYHRVYISGKEGSIKSDVVVFAKEIDKLARKSAEKTICFTGKRPKDLCGYNREAYKDCANYLAQYLEPFIQQGYTRFITGGAQGFDQIAFWVCVRLKRKYPKIKNLVFVPFDGFESRWLDSGPFSKAEFKKMCELADEVIVVNKHVSSGSTWEEINAAMKNRNRAMVDNAGLVIALSNETASGGTESTIRYALSKKIPVRCMRFDVSNNILRIAAVVDR